MQRDDATDRGLPGAEVAEVYRRYGFLLRRRCRVLLRNDALADDAMQETFMKVMRGGAALRDVDSPMRWLSRVADRACFDQLRRTKHLRHALAIDDATSEIPCHPGTSPEERQAAIEILDLLDEEDQRIAVMAFVDGMTQSEIAAELRYSRMTIIKRLAKVRELAERALRDRPSPPRRAHD